ncbi:hypothetical protein V6N11_072268 [Hibiscus sabdariffa]|uniref:Uncharacterized protein n=1 Tax=Hibiscus sabdariffa TaxID=183260 RepID=A0ABR2U2M0_9ROSI
MKDESMNVICVGKVQNEACLQARKVVGRALGELKLSGSGFNATPIIIVDPSDNYEVVYGERNIVLNKNENQPTGTVVKESVANWVDVVSSYPKGEVEPVHELNNVFSNNHGNQDFVVPVNQKEIGFSAVEEKVAVSRGILSEEEGDNAFFPELAPVHDRFGYMKMQSGGICNG